MGCCTGAICGGDAVTLNKPRPKPCKPFGYRWAIVFARYEDNNKRYKSCKYSIFLHLLQQKPLIKILQKGALTV
jgi:hypothetical protein